AGAGLDNRAKVIEYAIVVKVHWAGDGHGSQVGQAAIAEIHLPTGPLKHAAGEVQRQSTAADIKTAIANLHAAAAAAGERSRESRAIDDVDDCPRTDIEDGATREGAGVDGDVGIRADVEGCPAGVVAVGDGEIDPRRNVECRVGSAGHEQGDIHGRIGRDPIAGGHAEVKGSIHGR